MPDPKDYTLEVLEAMFSNRYSTTDSGYKEHCAQPIPPPPVIPHWKARDNSPSRHGERSRQRSFRSAYVLYALVLNYSYRMTVETWSAITISFATIDPELLHHGPCLRHSLLFG
ncbi:LOW QUALITY PROTEIN: hypothetical protein T265_14447 [Opisthorchis viverrini]|uniref:Uncharacterized protein n=1 Tax=Opisthorchis viverrini TaxID=6198 RepID=A0A074ZAL8_OPIVI|nr:LOW QUALITY PROTEIN: hypothetical protein T265_14447 [Opisthorchis viverrini]KER24336.1 LOW QUALITY PROTEIN: hypothetical protein T265_14447 [Opisthorchis viverrini]